MKGFILCWGILLMVLVLGIDNHAIAQTKAKQSILTQVPVSLGALGVQEVALSKAAFLQNMPSGIILMNSTGMGTVLGFNVTVFTHNLYEDSVGNPIIMQDIYTQFVDGATFAPHISQYFTDKLQLGDTILIDNIKVQMSGGAVLPGNKLQFAITRKD